MIPEEDEASNKDRPKGVDFAAFFAKHPLIPGGDEVLADLLREREESVAKTFLAPAWERQRQKPHAPNFGNRGAGGRPSDDAFGSLLPDHISDQGRDPKIQMDRGHQRAGTLLVGG